MMSFATTGTTPIGVAAAAAPARRVADVIIPLALDTAYSYAVPAGMELLPGAQVRVPFGPRREAIGVVWGLRAGDPGNLKQVIEPAGGPVFSDNLRSFLDWVARWTLAPRGSVLAMALKRPDEERGEVIRVGIRLAGPPPKRMTPARSRVIAAAEGGLLHGKSDLARAAGVSAGVIDGLVDEGTLETCVMPPENLFPPPDPDHAVTQLGPAQEAAARNLREAVAAHDAGAFLLEGVTGSGKTEVYFEAVAETLRAGRQSLILVPEIALTAQFLDRFAQRFGVRPAVWHSGVTGRKREKLYAGLASGEVRVVAGARSALFLPYADLGLIVVDEEHEAAYKQEDGVHYHARDMAVVRGRIDGCPVVLASATPTIETRVNAAQERYRHLILPERYGGRTLPAITAVDLRGAKAGGKSDDKPEGDGWISPPLAAAIEETMARGEQALIFLNRRGYAPLTLCRACGHRYECPNCSAWLVDHRFRRALVCHHCGHVARRPSACEACGTVDALAACGPGVERIAEEVATRFPGKRAITLSSDFPGGTERMRRELADIAAGKCDIVIGTQLVAKGHNFPGMTLVGVIDADIGLSSGDPRAAERTFQLLQQVTGRAGRGEKAGRALVQTYQPEHPVIAALISGDAERFYAQETENRRLAGLPPFGRLASLIISSRHREQAEAHARALARAAHAMDLRDPRLTLLGPAEAPIILIRGRYRYRLLLKSAREFDLQSFIRDWLAGAPKPRGDIRVQVDIDPQSFF
ncbi:MAG: primosomal protein N' (replication factor Y) PriA [Saliniramus fredricksonii]|uniref:Replication restart protein PriA n=2 Tax=Saliniramus fredricksonii TaxID=1653334 RepID=A0A0P7YE01_9HYPH|nr:MAG: primosomal protein N' (replication factor Y) PriA [Saliniramus fredricksonii]SCC82671.1 replication restart DNA helicase PriA [Saliniramus fredricksonii]